MNDIPGQTCKNPGWDFVREHLPHVRAWLSTLSSLLEEVSSGEEGTAEHAAASSPSPTHSETLGMEQRLDERLRQRAIFERYERFVDVFSSKQWAAISLRYRDGFGEEEIARRLQVGRTAINNRLQRARHVLEREERNLRAEAFRLSREDVDP